LQIYPPTNNSYYLAARWVVSSVDSLAVGLLVVVVGLLVVVVGLLVVAVGLLVVAVGLLVVAVGLPDVVGSVGKVSR
jgi:hypothetical protein